MISNATYARLYTPFLFTYSIQVTNTNEEDIPVTNTNQGKESKFDQQSPDVLICILLHQRSVFTFSSRQQRYTQVRIFLHILLCLWFCSNQKKFHPILESI